MVEQYSDSASIEQVLNSILDLDFRSSRRQCPKCTPRHLKVVTIEDTELDFCSRCKGLFFDPGELQQVLPGIASANAHPGNANRSDRQEGFWSSLLRMLDNG